MNDLAPIPPQNLEAEESVLGAMMMSKGALNACAEILAPDDFYRNSHGLIFKAMVDLEFTDRPVDVITLTEHMETIGTLDQAGGRPRLHELAALVPSTANAPHYASIVRDTASFRGLIRVGQEIARLGWERPGETRELFDQAEQTLFDLTTHRDSRELASLAKSLHETVELMHALRDKEITGLSTGLSELDTLTAGLQPGNLIIVAGRPSMGKSALALCLLNHAGMAEQPAAMFSLEMSEVEINQRLLSLQTGIPLTKLRKPKDLLQPEWSNIYAASSKLEQAPIYVDDSGDLRITELRSRARRLKAKRPDLALLVVDYLQLMAGDVSHANREQEVAQMSRGLKSLARELKLPVVCLSQLNRSLEARTDKRPMLSDLRESGAIEQDADVVIFVYRDEVYNKQTDTPGLAELIVAKHRQGPLATVYSRWSKLTARFSDAA